MNRQRSMLAALATLALAVTLASSSSAQTCVINARSTAGVNETFTLCAPTTGGYSYEWYGPGLSANNTSNCVNASGLGAGAHEFVLIRSRSGVEIDRCVHIVNVGGSSGGTTSCRISGPRSISQGSTATLCSPSDNLHSYSWTGPNGFTATTACITVADEGTYFLTSRNPLTGSSRQCTHRLDVVGSSGAGSATECGISGPEVITDGGAANLCAAARSNTSYRWTGPGGFTSTSRCISVSATGAYMVTLRNLSTGRTEQCTRNLTNTGVPDPDDSDPDAAYWDNCPRDLQFWRRAMAQNADGTSGLSAADLRTVAREVGRRSAFFNWANDVQGLRAALSPGAPLTRRKQIARQYAALLANVSAGELGLGIQGDNAIGLDLDTQIDFTGAATVGQLITYTERYLRESRGHFARLNAVLNQINRGRGIGPVCGTE